MGETERLTIRNSMLAMLRDAEVEQSAAIATALSHHVAPHVDRLLDEAEERGRRSERDRLLSASFAWPTGCGHRLAGGALACNRQDDHEPGNCTYAATNGVHTKKTEGVEQ